MSMHPSMALSSGIRHPENGCTGVLVAEDDPMFRKILQSWLESWGYRVTVAEDGAKAWSVLQREHPPEF